MPIFNPNVPNTNDPNYLGYSQRPQQMEANRQWEALFKGVGNVLDTGFKAVDTVVKAKIEDTVNQGVDAMRNAYTNVLERVSGTPESERVSSDTTTSGSALNLLPSGTQNVPEEISGVGNYAANLRNSFLSGKISKTHYEGTLARFAKSVRDRYPGWRDYVDQEVAQAISANKPANQYIEGLIQDMNQRLGHQRTETDKMLQIVKENPGMPRAAELAQAVINGSLDRSEFYRQFVNYKGPIDRAQNERIVLGLEADRAQGQSRDATQSAVGLASSIAGSHLSATQTVNGVSTPGQIQAFITDVISGKKNPTSQEIDKWAQDVKLTKVNAITAINAEFDKVDPVTKKSLRQHIGATEANRIINESTKIYDDISELVTNKEFGIAFSLGRINTSLLDSTKNKLFTHPTIGHFVQKLSIVSGMGPEVAERFIRHSLAADPRLNETLNDVFLVDAISAASGDKRSFLQIIDQANARGVRSGNYNARVLRLVDRVVDPTEHPDIKANLVEAAFKERGLISRLPNDDAKYSFFTKVGSQEFATEVRKLSALPNREGLWQQYKDWIENTGAKELIPTEIGNLRSIQNMRGVRVGWDNENDRLVIDTGSATRSGVLGRSTRDPAGPAEVRMAQRVEFRINRVLDAIKPIAKIEGTDVDSYLVGTLIGLGLDPTKMDTSGLPEQIIQAIKANRLRQQMRPRAGS